MQVEATLHFPGGNRQIWADQAWDALGPGSNE